MPVRARGHDPAPPAERAPCEGRDGKGAGWQAAWEGVRRTFAMFEEGSQMMTGGFSSLLSIFSLQLKLPVRSGSHFSWAVCPWIMAYPGVYSGQVNKTLWERTLLNRRGVVSPLSEVQGSYLVPVLRCEQERFPPWTHTSGSSLFSSHSLPSQPKGYTNLELMTSLLDHWHSRYPRPWNFLPKQPGVLFEGLAQGQTEQPEYPLLAHGWPRTAAGEVVGGG